MKISIKTQYGLRAIAYVAGSSKDHPCSVKEISVCEAMPFDFLEKILSKLEKTGFVYAKKGAGGGYFLARPAKNIRLGEIVSALEGNTVIVKCAGAKGSDRCPNSRRCKTKNFWKKVQHSIENALNSATLADLL